MNATILLALLNGLWQGIALVAITMLALRFWRGRNAATTCAIWSAVYLAVALLPIVDVALQYRVTAQTMPIVSPVIALTDTSLGQPLRATTVDRTTTSPATRVVVARPDVTFVAAPPSLLSRIDSAARAIGTRAGTIAAAVALPLFVLWGLIAVS